jgi:threonyl-tRNA synthetase
MPRGSAASHLKSIRAEARSTDQSRNSCGAIDWDDPGSARKVQLDGVLPPRLEACYVAPDGGRARPPMIRHAIFGSLGRMIAILLEHHGGVLPFWLSPDQVAVAPISKDQAGYGAEVLAAFEDAGIRAVAFDGADTLSRRIVAAHDMAVPVMAIVGGREMRDGRVTLRERCGAQADAPLAEAVSRLQARARPGAVVAEAS